MAHVIKVLKSDQVLVSGSVRLEIGGGIAPVRTGPSIQTDTGTDAAAQQARIVESNSEYAVIEVTCRCGSKSFIQCNYAELAGPETPAK